MKKLGTLLLIGSLAGCGRAMVQDAATDSPTPTPNPAGSATPTPGATPTPSDATDGAPSRQPCTSSFGNGLSNHFGRLDGTLVAIVSPGTHGCNGDSNHVHLQISMNGGIYDVAVNVHDNSGGSVFFTERDLAIPDGAWAEGWHTADQNNYVSLGLHAADFTATPESALSAQIESELADVNHISVFATGYNSSGIHEVHRVNGGNDGAIIIHPLSSTARVMFFHFANQSF